MSRVRRTSHRGPAPEDIYLPGVTKTEWLGGVARGFQVDLPNIHIFARAVIYTTRLSCCLPTF